ncbi:hypothetical protein ACG98G_02875 [Megasphaera hexanoica]|uniref:Uncharacterized protein n=1 Tax=Megasphaera hexanoica TaxID=1675036 RepID=A0ABW7DNK0_9FIRM|nr:hypothetical protein [Megasphaera hexanoica]
MFHAAPRQIQRREPAGMGRVGIRRPDAWSPVLKLYHSPAGDSKAV